ncbi:MAG TPA: hypothetical protein DCP68_00085 [Ruminococcus sp.]|nr:hypothetical protein [Ruminococcus sp.]
MKKFISALSSLVIAATAMGGALAISTDAASTPDSTIVAFRSNGESSVKASAGDKVPVSVYVPQSQGFNTLTLKTSINGDATLDQGSVKDMNGKVYENFKGSFGNYGITISDVAWPQGGADPCCLDSGIISGQKMFAGYAEAGNALFTENAFSIMYQASHAISYTAAKYGLEKGSKDIDSYIAWEAAGKPKYDEYTPAFTWSKDDFDSYKYPLVSFNLNLPSNLKDGTYVLDVYYDEYLNCNPSALFDSKTNDPLPESMLTYSTSSAKGIGGANTLKSEKLTITVGEPPQGGETTTTAPVTTPAPDKATTTVKQDDPPVVDPAGAIVYDLKTANSTLSGDKNTVTVKPGEKIDVLWTVSKDQKIAGMQMYFDISEIIAAGGKYLGAEQGDAYMLIPTFNDDFAGKTREEDVNGGQIIYTFGGNKEYIAAEDGALIYTFQIQAPEKAGTYNIVNDTSRGDVTKVTPRVGDPLSFVIHELAITVSGDEPKETTTTVTTPAQQQQTTTTVTTPAQQQQTTTTATTPEDGDVLYGDVNCDKQVRINDVVLLNRYLAKTADVSAQGKKNADCVKDGNITADDSTAIKEFLARLIPSLPKQ